MAREVFVKLWCDAHMAEDPNARVEGETVPIKVGNVQGELDMCDEHRHALVDPLVTLLHQLGKPIQQKLPMHVPANGKPASARTAWCYVCERSQGNPNVNAHYMDEHGVGQDWVVGSTCPLDGQRFKTFQGMAMHLSRSHDELVHEQAFREADRAGDPHGVLAALRERVKAVQEKG